MNAHEAFNARAALVLAERKAGRSLREIVAIFRLDSREAARALEARGRRLERESNPPPRIP